MKKQWLLLMLVCLCGCASESAGPLLLVPPDPPVAKPIYGEQGFRICKPGALEFWPGSPMRQGCSFSIIRMWFPEAAGISDPNGKKLWGFEIWNDDPTIWQKTETHLRGECDIPIGGKFVRTVTKDGDSLHLTMSFQNSSNITWTKATGGSCLQLAAAADYEDNIGDRTYWVLDGVPTPTYKMAITDATMRGVSYLGRTVEMKDGTTKTITEAVAFVVSKDDKYVLGYSWQPADCLFYNRAGIVACVHVEPPAFEVPAGQTKTAKGIIFLHEGTLDQAYQRYLNWKAKL